MSITRMDAYNIAGFIPSGVLVRDIGPPELLKLSDIDESVLSYGRFLRRFMLMHGH